MHDHDCGAPRANGRRQFVAGVAALSGAALLGRAPAVLSQSNAPLRIGVLNSFSKVFAALGNANLNGMQMYFEQIGGSIGASPVVARGATKISTVVNSPSSLGNSNSPS